MQELKFSQHEVANKVDFAIKQLLSDDPKDWAEPEAILNAVLNTDNNYTLSLAFLGVLASKRDQNGLAVNLLNAAIANEKLPNNLGVMHKNLGVIYKMKLFDEEKARHHFELAMKYAPDDVESLIDMGSMFLAEGKSKTAVEYFDKALKMDPNHLEGHWNLSLALLEQGNYRRGFEEYCHGFRKRSKTYRDYKVPEWDGSPGKTVIVYGEQGIGDEILFASVLPDLIKISKQVILDAHPRLCDIFRRSFPNIAVYGTRKCGQISWMQFWPNADAQISIASLPRFFRKEKKDFPKNPYLKADPKLIDLYKAKLEALGNKPKIGISWKGGTPGTGSKHRRFNLKKLLPIFQAIDADFFSLQYTEGAQEKVDEFNKEYPQHFIHHWQRTIDDYDHTAALVSCLDLVITVPQSIVHLAGALGTMTFQMTPKRILWQGGVYGEDSLIWYGCVKLFWQDETENWDVVINNVKEELCRLSQTNTKN